MSNNCSCCDGLISSNEGISLPCNHNFCLSCASLINDHCLVCPSVNESNDPLECCAFCGMALEKDQKLSFSNPECNHEFCFDCGLALNECTLCIHTIKPVSASSTFQTLKKGVNDVIEKGRNLAFQTKENISGIIKGKLDENYKQELFSQGFTRDQIDGAERNGARDVLTAINWIFINCDLHQNSKKRNDKSNGQTSATLSSSHSSNQLSQGDATKLLKSLHQERCNRGKAPIVMNDEEIERKKKQEVWNSIKHTWSIHELDELQLIEKYFDSLYEIIQDDIEYKANHKEIIAEKEIHEVMKKRRTQLVGHAWTINDLPQLQRITYIPKPIHPSQECAPMAIRDENMKLSSVPHIPGNLEVRGIIPNLPDLDFRIINYSCNPNQSHDDLARGLIRDLMTDHNDEMKKVWIIFGWVSTHIIYDINQVTPDNNATFDDQREKDRCNQILRNGQRAVCVGYALLMKWMLRAIGIHCDYVDGYTKLGKESNYHHEGHLSGHAWNAVGVNGRTYMIDATWSNWNQKDQNRFIKSTYFLVPPDHFRHQFFPTGKFADAKWQFVSAGDEWNVVTFLNKPCFYPGYFASKIQILDQNGLWGTSFKLRLNRDQPYTLTFMSRETSHHALSFNLLHADSVAALDKTTEKEHLGWIRPSAPINPANFYANGVAPADARPICMMEKTIRPRPAHARPWTMIRIRAEYTNANNQIENVPYVDYICQDAV